MRHKKGVQLQTADPNSSQENAIIYNCGQLKFCLNDSLEYADLHAIIALKTYLIQKILSITFKVKFVDDSIGNKFYSLH